HTPRPRASSKPAAPDPVPLYEPTVARVLVTPDAEPANVLPPIAVTPLIVIVKSAALFVPPLSLMTCLITVSVAGLSSFVITQVLLAPAAIVPEQPGEALVIV